MEQKIFVVSMGRSGTHWTARLINEATSFEARHEPRGNEQNALVHAFEEGETVADDYVHNEVSLNTDWIEVNSYLRYHASALVRKKQKVKYQVRNGKNCVSSMMNRGSVYRDGEWQIYLRPLKGDKYYDEWSKFNPFQKTCWYWWHPNQYLNNLFGGYHHKIEEITSDWKAVDNMFSFDIDREKWGKLKDQKEDSTDPDRFPYPEDWSKKQHRQFDQICGNLMEKFGYE